MNCEETKSLLHGYLDRELDLAKSLEVEEHLRGCPICGKEAEAHQSLKDLVQTNAEKLRYASPSRLEKNLRRSLRETFAEKPPSFWGRRKLFPVFAASAFALLFALTLGFLYLRSAADFQREEILSSHIRSLMPGHLTDVASSDQHTVKPWFSGKLDYSPTVKDFASEGFPLVGGRLDYVAQRPVAVLVYQRRQHVINLFLRPASEAGAPRAGMETLRGYHVLSWNKSGFSYSAVSDLDPVELKAFAALVQSQGS
ncbi:MAG: anti-sigma factor [bacterium]